MACEFKWQKACQIDNSLPMAENWVEKLTLRQIANLRFPDPKDGSDKKALLMVLDNRVENGSLEFDDVEIFSEWHFPDVTVIFPSCGYDDKFMGSIRQREREYIANRFLAAHKPTCGWVIALKEVKQGDSITLKQHPCQCHCTCELIKSFHNGLPRKWEVTGEHEVTEEHKNGLKVNFSCKAIPIITAKQCYDLLALIKLPAPTDSILSGWWESLELEGNNGAGIIEGNIEANNEQVSIPSINNSSTLNADTDINNPELIKSERQIIAILKAIKIKEWQPFEIPDGEKSGSIEPICMVDYPLLFDGTTSFENAWKAGKKFGLFRMMNDASYAKRGKK
ncbi:MAG: hypothetical protein QX189_10650 [Methylococcales bacterium]